MTPEMEILFLEKILHWNKVGIERMEQEKPVEIDGRIAYPVVEPRHSAKYAFDQAAKLEEVMEMFK